LAVDAERIALKPLSDVQLILGGWEFEPLDTPKNSTKGSRLGG
jgi:hypothetical protein